MSLEELCTQVLGWEADRAWRGTWVAENSRSWEWFNSQNQAMARCGWRSRADNPPCNLLAQVAEDGAHRCDWHNEDYWRRREHA